MLAGGAAAWQQAFLEEQQLPRAYLRDAHYWFAPLAESLLTHCDSALASPGGPGRGAAGHKSGPLLVGVNGSQGSGKSTVCAYLCALLAEEYGRRAISLSLDDFYLTRARRHELADLVHPLLATRGVPGTHDTRLLNETLDALSALAGSSAVAVPRFDKGLDDRRPRSQWDEVAGSLDIVLLEGWCLGVRPQPTAALRHPVNALELDEDPRGRWREYVNQALQRDFLPLYERIDTWVMLQAPSFACVYDWRLEQEQKLALKEGGGKEAVMDASQVARFIQHYQRLTEHCLATLPPQVDYLYLLDEERGVIASRPERESAL